MKKDLQSLLYSYAHMIRKPFVSVDAFVTFLEKQARREGASQLLHYWAEGTYEKVVDELAILASDGRVVYTEGQTRKKELYLPNFARKCVEQSYAALSHKEDEPFPDIASLGITIPADEVLSIDVEGSLLDWLGKESESTETRILRLMFDHGFGEFVTLPAYLPDKLLEASFDKLSELLRTNSMTDYFQQKTMSQFHGREPQVRDFYQCISTSTEEAIRRIKECNDFTFSLWSFVCQLIRSTIVSEIARLGIRTGKDIGLYQTLSLISIFNNYYKIIEMNKKKKDMAFGVIESCLASPPYMYTMKEIYKFTDKGGIPILNKCAASDLEEFIHQKMSRTDENIMPDLIRYRIGEGHEPIFVLKNKIPLLCGQLLNSTKPMVKAELVRRWTEMLRDYRAEPAMNDPGAFEILLGRLAQGYTPAFIAMLEDPRTPLVYAETPPTGDIPKLYDVVKPLPLRTIFELKQGTILYDCRLALPFWYSIAPIVAMVTFFKNIFRKKPKRAKKAVEKPATDSPPPPPVSSLKSTASDALKDLCGAKDTDAALASLRDRWNQKISPAERANLTTSVDAIIRDNARFVMKLQQNARVSRSMMEDTAQNIIDQNSALKEITGQDALRKYIALSLIKIILGKK